MNQNSDDTQKDNPYDEFLRNLDPISVGKEFLTEAYKAMCMQIRIKNSGLKRTEKNLQEQLLLTRAIQPMREFLNKLRFSKDPLALQAYEEIKDYIFNQSKMFNTATKKIGNHVVRRESDEMLGILLPGLKKYVDSKDHLSRFLSERLNIELPWSGDKSFLKQQIRAILRKAQQQIQEWEQEMEQEQATSTDIVATREGQELEKYNLIMVKDAVHYFREKYGEDSSRLLASSNSKPADTIVVSMDSVDASREKHKNYTVDQLKPNLLNERCKLQNRIEAIKLELQKLDPQKKEDRETISHLRKSASKLQTDIDRINNMLEKIDQREAEEKKRAKAITTPAQAQKLSMEIQTVQEKLTKTWKRYTDLSDNYDSQSQKTAAAIISIDIPELEDKIKNLQKQVSRQLPPSSLEQEPKTIEQLKEEAQKLMSADRFEEAQKLTAQAIKQQKEQEKEQAKAKKKPATAPKKKASPVSELEQEILANLAPTQATETVLSDPDDVQQSQDNDTVKKSEDEKEHLIDSETDDWATDNLLLMAENALTVSVASHKPSEAVMDMETVTHSDADSNSNSDSNFESSPQPSVSIPQAQPATPPDIREAETIWQLRQYCLGAKYLGFAGKIETYIKNNFADKDVDEKIPPNELADLFDWLRLGDYLV